MLAVVLLIGCLVGAGLSATTEDCPSSLPRDDYLQIKDGVCYQFVMNERKSFSDAQSHCKEQGGQLAIVKSQSVDTYLREKLKKTYAIYYSPIWIGLKSNMGDFNWVDGSQVSYNDLENTSPRLGSDDCIAVSPSSKYWLAFTCNSYFFEPQKNRFICQYKATKTSTEAENSCPVKNDENPKTIQELGDTCYYFAIDTKLSFPKAEAYCEKYGGRLASVKSQKINDFLQHHLFVTHGIHTSIYGFWIGLKYNEDRKIYYWMDGTVVQYSNFDKYSSYKGYCATMEPSDGEWNRDYCTDYSFDARQFICEFDKTSSGIHPTTQTTPKTPKIETTKLLTLPTVPTTKAPPTPPPHRKGKCPIGSGEFVQTLDDKCYYFDLEDSLTFQAAEAFCEKHGGTLVMPKTQKINEFLQHHLHVTHKMGYSSKSLWIGLRKAKSYLDYKWVDGSSLAFKRFRSKKSSRGCGAILPTDGEWENASCYDNSIYGDKKNFICEF